MTSTPGREASPGRYSKGIRRRQEILDRALEVIAEKGVSGISLRAIGDAIGVSHAALTHYFPSLEALLIEVLRERDTAGGSAVEKSPHSVEYMARAAEHNVDEPGLVALYTSMMGTSVEHDDVVARDFFRERFARSRKEVAERLEAEFSERGVTPDIDPDAVASLLIAASDGLQVQWLLDPSVDIAGTIRLLQRLVEPHGAPAPDAA